MNDHDRVNLSEPAVLLAAAFTTLSTAYLKIILSVFDCADVGGLMFLRVE